MNIGIQDQKDIHLCTELNGRFGWDWNHAGYGKIVIDDSKLRSTEGEYFLTMGFHFPHRTKDQMLLVFQSGKIFRKNFPLVYQAEGAELAVFFIGVTNPMQSRVENATIYC